VFLIDGYNLLHAVARGRATPEARVQLVSLIETWCRTGGYRARIVFDATGGMKRREERGGLEIRSVPQGRTADEEILEAVSRTEDRTEFTVVSNDLGIVKAAEKKGFKVLPCEDFARQVLQRPDAPEKSDSASGAEVDYWMREFGIEE
jgi:predicted RNA-binding protein with PIN domain